MSINAPHCVIAVKLRCQRRWPSVSAPVRTSANNYTHHSLASPKLLPSVSKPRGLPSSQNLSMVDLGYIVRSESRLNATTFDCTLTIMVSEAVASILHGPTQRRVPCFTPHSFRYQQHSHVALRPSQMEHCSNHVVRSHFGPGRTLSASHMRVIHASALGLELATAARRLEDDCSG